MLLSTFLASVMFAFGSSLANGEEWLYAQTGNGWQVYDPETGEHLQSWYVPTLINNQGLLYHDGRLYTLNMNLVIWRDFMVELHPATSRYVEIGKTGLSFSAGYVSLVRDPTMAKSYVQANDLIYELDMKSGVLSYLSRIEQGIAIITAIAINSEGIAYGASTPSIYDPEAALYEVDVRTGQLHRIGELQPTPITFKTLAFDAQGRLWGSGYGPFSFQKHRLYRIDLGTLQFQSVFPFPTEFPGVSAIAFGPKPDVEAYCEPKTNSAGCTPTIGWKGHPSASAHFGFEVRATQVVSDSPGFLMLGFGGQASVPFQGGTLCVAEPTLRTTPQVSGSEAGCSATWSLDVNTWLLGNHPLAPGDRFTCQWWGRDPGLTGPESSQLSDALEVVLLP